MGFYCQKLCGGIDYRKAQIDAALKDCEGMNFTPKDVEMVVREVHSSFQCKCTVQCNHCANVVAETQMKTKKLIDAKSNIR